MIEKSEADILMVAREDDFNFESVEHAEAARYITKEENRFKLMRNL